LTQTERARWRSLDEVAAGAIAVERQRTDGDEDDDGVRGARALALTVETAIVAERGRGLRTDEKKRGSRSGPAAWFRSRPTHTSCRSITSLRARKSRSRAI
jgi:hypothetical protein